MAVSVSVNFLPMAKLIPLRLIEQEAPAATMAKANFILKRMT